MHIRRLSISLQERSRTFSNFLLILLLSGFILNACQSDDSTLNEIDLEWNLSPTPPVVGESTLLFTLTDTSGASIENADIVFEANMSHPGMAPVIGKAVEIEPGRYTGEFSFTMGGDWYILIEATLDDERVIEKQIAVSGVRSE